MIDFRAGTWGQTMLLFYSCDIQYSQTIVTTWPNFNRCFSTSYRHTYLENVDDVFTCYGGNNLTCGKGKKIFCSWRYNQSDLSSVDRERAARASEANFKQATFEVKLRPHAECLIRPAGIQSIAYMEPTIDSALINYIESMLNRFFIIQLYAQYA